MTAVAAGRAEARAKAPSFYVWMAWAFVATAFLGFLPTYFAPLAAGKFQANPVIHIHGVVFFVWTFFFLAQTMLVPAGQTARHRSLGLAGVSLATALVFLGLLAALNSLKMAEAFGPPVLEAAKKFAVLPLTAIPAFAVFFALAVFNIRRPEAHKRLMLLAMVSLLDAPLARPFLAFVFQPPPGPPPVIVGLPGALIADLFVVVAMAYDWKTRGRPHITYLIGFPALLALHLLRLPISETEAWNAIASSFVALGGAFPAPPAG
jgi:hypothetical protein